MSIKSLWRAFQRTIVMPIKKERGFTRVFMASYGVVGFALTIVSGGASLLGWALLGCALMSVATSIAGPYFNLVRDLRQSAGKDPQGVEISGGYQVKGSTKDIYLVDTTQQKLSELASKAFGASPEKREKLKLKSQGYIQDAEEAAARLTFCDKGRGVAPFKFVQI